MAFFQFLSSNTTSLGFLRSGGILAGNLPKGESVVLDTANSPYTSDGSLVIDGNLEIMPNVTIQMAEGSSLVVRKGSIKAVGTSEEPVVFAKLNELEWGGLAIESKIGVAPTFQLLLAYRGDNTYSVGRDQFNSRFESSQSKTLVRYCPECYSSHQFIFYKRISNTTNFDAYNSLTCNFTDYNNELNTDFGELYEKMLLSCEPMKGVIICSYLLSSSELYHSMVDLLNGTNKWSYCQYLSGYGFPGRCGQFYRTWYQSSEFIPTCPTSSLSYQQEVYWFLYDDVLSSELYQPEWTPSGGTSSGLPFVFASMKDIELQHIVISGAGADSEYSLSLERSSAVPFKDISILNGMGNGLKVSKNMYNFEDLTIKSDTSSSGNGVHIDEGGKVSIDGYFISTKHSGNAVYVDSQSSLSLSNGEIIPKSNSQYAIYGYYADSLVLENFFYTFASGHTQYREPIYTNRLRNIFALKDGVLNCSSLSSYDYAIDLRSYGATARSTIIQNVSFVGNDRSFGGYFRTSQGSGDVVFNENYLFRGDLYYDAVRISSETAVVTRNNISNVTTNSNLFDISASNSTTANNEIHHVMSGQGSIISVKGNFISVTENKIVNAEGNSAIYLDNVEQLDITRNSVINPTVEYYLKTDTNFDYTTNNHVLAVGANYWSTTSFEELNKGTYDSSYDSSLIRYVVHYTHFDGFSSWHILTQLSCHQS